LPLHRDIRVDDVDAARRAVLALGAARLAAEDERGFFADPAGYLFLPGLRSSRLVERWIRQAGGLR
jgi:hypothetical protein